jgi:hypothetical protein
LADQAKKDNLNTFEKGIKSEIISTSSSKNANDETDKFDYDVKLKFYVIGYAKSDLDSVLIGFSNNSLGSNKMLINPDKAEITYDLVDSNIDTGILKINAKLVGKSGQKLDENSIKKQIKGKSVASAKQLILNNSGVEGVDIEMKPNLNIFRQIPYFTKNIKLTFGYSQ